MPTHQHTSTDNLQTCIAVYPDFREAPNNARQGGATIVICPSAALCHSTQHPSPPLLVTATANRSGDFFCWPILFGFRVVFNCLTQRSQMVPSNSCLGHPGDSEFWTLYRSWHRLLVPDGYRSTRSNIWYPHIWSKPYDRTMPKLHCQQWPFFDAYEICVSTFVHFGPARSEIIWGHKFCRRIWTRRNSWAIGFVRPWKMLPPGWITIFFWPNDALWEYFVWIKLGNETMFSWDPCGFKLCDSMSFRHRASSCDWIISFLAWQEHSLGCLMCFDQASLSSPLAWFMKSLCMLVFSKLAGQGEIRPRSSPRGSELWYHL